MAKQNSLKRAPYSRNTGDLIGYADSFNEDRYDWEPNEPFEVTRMDIVGMTRGQSSARFTLKDARTGVSYPMFMSSMLDLVQNANVRHGEVWDEQWIVVKRGANYGLELYRA